jgi:two-component sensor histidine kinase
VGFPVNLNFSDSSSLGLKLIHTLTKQLKGTVDLSNKDGAFVQLNFNQNNIVI